MPNAGSSPASSGWWEFTSRSVNQGAQHYAWRQRCKSPRNVRIRAKHRTQKSLHGLRHMSFRSSTASFFLASGADGSATIALSRLDWIAGGRAAEAGISCSILRVPVTFPPENFSGVLLSGMCVPDLKGSQGTFSFCSTRPSSDKFREGGVRVPIERAGSGYISYVPGPEDPLCPGSGSELRVKFEIDPAPGNNEARLTIDSETFTLKVGEYSDWIPVKFKASIGFSAHGICRFYLKEISPEIKVYVTPVNIDPGRPDLPISHPVTYLIYLAKLFAPYATLGLAEDTWALNEKVLDDKAFLAQCYSNYEDRERML